MRLFKLSLYKCKASILQVYKNSYSTKQIGFQSFLNHFLQFVVFQNGVSSQHRVSIHLEIKISPKLVIRILILRCKPGDLLSYHFTQN